MGSCHLSTARWQNLLQSLRPAAAGLLSASQRVNDDLCYQLVHSHTGASRFFINSWIQILSIFIQHQSIECRGACCLSPRTDTPTCTRPPSVCRFVCLKRAVFCCCCCCLQTALVNTSTPSSTSAIRTRAIPSTTTPASTAPVSYTHLTLPTILLV